MSTLVKYRLLLGPQVTASVNASVNTSVDLSHPRVLGAASYVYYENGSVITPTMTGTDTLIGSRTGRTNGQSYQYQVAAVDSAGREGPKSSASTVNIPSTTTAYGTVTTYFEADFEGADLAADGLEPWAPVTHDAYDHTVDHPTEVTALRALHGSKSCRVQLTAHRFGTNTWPNSSGDYLIIPGTVDWYYKAAGGPGGQLAHRNEFMWSGSSNPAELISFGEEHWFGFAVFLPGANDALGDAEWKPISFWSYSYGPQLHPTNIAGVNGANPAIAFQHGSARWPARAQAIGGLVYPNANVAPAIRYKRGSDQYNPNNSAFLNQSTSAAQLRVEWDAVPGFNATRGDTYRVYASTRSEGPWALVQDATARTYAVDGLGTMSSMTNKKNRYVYVIPVMNGAETRPSLICPAPRYDWGANHYGASGSSGWSAGSAMTDRGRWVKWVLRYRLSNTGTGYFEAWKDGVKVYSRFGIDLGSTNPGYHYWRMGIYSDVLVENAPLDPLNPAAGTWIERPVPADWPARANLYYDDIRMARRTGADSTPTSIGNVPTTIDDPAYIAVAPRG